MRARWLLPLLLAATAANALDAERHGPSTFDGAIACSAGKTCDVSGLSVTAGGTTRNLASWLPLFGTLSGAQTWTGTNTFTNRPIFNGAGLATLSDIVSGSYLGQWDASANSPTLTATPASNGSYYVVSSAGTQSITGSSATFAAGDTVKSNGTAWQRIPAFAPVVSVAGKQGAISLTSSDVGLGNVSNLAPANLPLSTADATALAGKEPSISAGTAGQYWRGDKTWQTLSIPTNTNQLTNGAGFIGATAAADALTMQRETSSNRLTIQQRFSDMISVAEYANADHSITQTQLNALTARAKLEGKSIFIPGGTWTTSGTLTIDRSDQTGYNAAALRSDIVGQGSATTTWTYTGTGRAFYIKGGATGTGQEAHERVSGFLLIGPSATTDGSIGIGLDHISWLGLDDVYITNFDKGVDGLDVEYLRALRAVIRFNKRGVTMDSRANNSSYTADPTSSDPNSHTWIASTLANNTEYGADYHRGNTLSFVGSDIQYNGLSAADGSNPAGARPGFGIRNTDPGTQGGVGLSMQGGYVEGNAGVADVWLRQQNSAFSATSFATYSITGTGFTRTSSSARSTNFIALDFITASGTQAVNIQAAFKNFSPATSTGPAVAFIGAKQQKDIELNMTGSVYTAGEAVDEWVPYTATVTGPSGSTGFAATVSGLFYKRWRTAHVQGTISIPAAGATQGSGTMSVPLPIAIRGGAYGSCSSSDLTSVTPVYGAIAAGGSALLVNGTVTSVRSFGFACEYPTN
jgi:hypothetical protein